MARFICSKLLLAGFVFCLPLALFADGLELGLKQQRLSQEALASVKVAGTSLVVVTLKAPAGFVDPALLDAQGRSAQYERVLQQMNKFLMGVEAELAVVFRSAYFPYLVLEADTKALASWLENPLVARIDPNRILEPQLADATLAMGSQGTNRAGYRGRGQAIAIIDTGIDTTHPSFAPIDGQSRFVSEACFSPTTDPAVSICAGERARFGPGVAEGCALGAIRQCGHGTNVAGVALARSSTAFPEDGVAPDADIVAIRAGIQTPCDEDDPTLCHRFSDASLLASLEHVLSLQLTGSVNVASVNLSLGSGRFIESSCSYESFDHLTRSLTLRGVAVVSSSGNSALDDSGETVDGIGYPACLSDVISVGAVSSDELAPYILPFSQPSVALDLLAPGVARVPVDQGMNGQLSGFAAGTSIASPFVAGAIALLREAEPTAAVSTLVGALRDNGLPVLDFRLTPERFYPRIEVNTALEVLQGRILPVSNVRLAPTPNETWRVFWDDNRHRRVSGSEIYTLEGRHVGTLSFAKPVTQVTQAGSSGRLELAPTTGTPYSVTVMNCVGKLCATSQPTTDVLRPSQPREVSAHALSDGEIEVRWAASTYSSGESSFLLSNSAGGGSVPLSNQETRWRLRGLAPGTTVNFYLKECRSDPLPRDEHCSMPAELQARTVLPAAPPAPLDLHRCGRPGEFCLRGPGLRLQWRNRVSHLTTHNEFAWRAAGATGSWNSVELHPKAYTYALMAPSGQLISARVRACNGASCSAWSNTVQATVP